MYLNLKERGRIVSFWAGGSLAATPASIKTHGRRFLNLILDFSPGNILRRHQ